MKEMKQNYYTNVGLLAVTIMLIVFLSYVSVNIWGGSKVEVQTLTSLNYDANYTIKEFAAVNNLPDKVVKLVFDLQNVSGLNQPISSFPVNEDKLIEKINVASALYAESLSKDWIKIVAKFSLWFIFLTFVYILIRKNKVLPQNRKWLYLFSFVIFGIILGSDPSPMGTVKDAITMYAIQKALFIPRFVALTVFLTLVVVLNKFICSWGCQLGTLQDFIFRLNRNKQDTKGIIRQYKVPFVVSNSIRIVFFALFTLIAFIWSFDLIEYFDPFKLFHPQVVNLAGWLFLAVILAGSMFVYRPWCHFFCPFGLVGWLFEKLSIVKIKVDYEKCVACNACSKACPSMVMDSILKQDKTIPDCFSCINCINVCPEEAISFSTGKRQQVPEGKFEK